MRMKGEPGRGSSKENAPRMRMSFPYRLLRVLVRTVLALLARFVVTGEENLPSSGPCILVTNHLHLFDPIVLMAVLPFQVDVLVADKYRRKFPIGQIVSFAGGTFVRRGEVDRKALRKCLRILKSGGILGMSPEGTRSKTGTLQRAKPGVAYFVYKTGAPLLPVGTWGTERVLSGWRPFRRQEVHIAIGKPFVLSPPPGRLRSRDLQVMADEIMVRIARLIPAEYRGVYAAQARGGTFDEDSTRERPGAGVVASG